MKDGNWRDSLPLGTFDANAPLAAVNDFNGDGVADILFRNPTTGKVDGWVIDHGMVDSTVSFGSLNTAYSLAGTGDFDHAGGADLLWVNPTTGQTGTWLLHGI